MLNYLKAIRRYYKNEKYNFERLHELHILTTGIEDGLLFIQLNSGMKFFGYPSDPVQRKQFELLAPQSIKDKISPEYFNIAIDITKRYLTHRDIEEARKKSRFLNVMEGNIAIEGGAFTGYYAMQLSQSVGEKGMVVAIEAVPENFKLLKKNIESNNLTNVIAVNKALSNQKGTATFFRKKKQEGSIVKGMVSEKNQISVECDLVDNIVTELNLPKIDFIRLQLNGAELNALKGMSKTLQHQPQVLVAAPYSKDGIPFKKKIIDYLESIDISSQSVLSNVCINVHHDFVPSN